MYVDDGDGPLAPDKALWRLQEISADCQNKAVVEKAFIDVMHLEFAKRGLAQHVDIRLLRGRPKILDAAKEIVSEFYRVIDTAIIKMAAEDAKTLRQPSNETKK